MRKTLLIIFLGMTSLVAMSQTAQEQRIIDLSKKKFQWMIAMNFDSLESVLDDRMVFIHSNGWPETKTEFINDIKSGKLRYKSIEVVEASARMYQGSAVIIGRGKFKVALDGKDLDLELKYTEFYIQKNGKWLLASRHANRLQ
ncbi:MAG TPA: nuclear transport factor 2 family protein [Cyclobacteriaceae bacterium]|nr:nuclear transport factor 2 family protein [Cyclobacteriaceae bacterium]HMV09088.1 nuclear transport factor 2 family protein [Cyclobacteriaceae bacterium]HMV90039.1 nuclear transport factor 2 family protein [Cyclobacteriaceae bacterium]HMW99507.1 nuclear transport factor 2 family protein [Cyclobacteriaceae bacterium]HMX48704.1 nuclear transport factor 2 family protein [Cyclobacteriaceae bacterium]